MKSKHAVQIGLLALTLALTGCSSNEQDKLKEDVKAAETEVSDFVKETEKISKEDIQKATDYIEANIDKVKDLDVAKNLIKAGNFLEKAAKDDSEAAKQELVKLGKETKEYATKIYTAADDEKDTLIAEGKETFASWTTKLTNEKDKLVEDFHNLLNK